VTDIVPGGLTARPTLQAARTARTDAKSHLVRRLRKCVGALGARLDSQDCTEGDFRRASDTEVDCTLQQWIGWSLASLQKIAGASLFLCLRFPCPNRLVRLLLLVHTAFKFTCEVPTGCACAPRLFVRQFFSQKARGVEFYTRWKLEIIFAVQIDPHPQNANIFDWRKVCAHNGWCCFYYFMRNSLVALLETLFARCTLGLIEHFVFGQRFTQWKNWPIQKCFDFQRTVQKLMLSWILKFCHKIDNITAFLDRPAAKFWTMTNH